MTWRWAKVPDALIRSDASDRAVRLYALLDRCGGRTATAWPSRDYLARAMRCSVASVDRAVAELRAAGWLVVVRQGRGPNLYALSPDCGEPVDGPGRGGGRAGSGNRSSPHG